MSLFSFSETGDPIEVEMMTGEQVLAQTNLDLKMLLDYSDAQIERYAALSYILDVWREPDPFGRGEAHAKREKREARKLMKRHRISIKDVKAELDEVALRLSARGSTLTRAVPLDAGSVWAVPVDSRKAA